MVFALSLILGILAVLVIFLVGIETRRRKVFTSVFTIAIVGLAVWVGVSVFSPGQSAQEREFIDTARAAAEDIPLPVAYCPNHGVAYVFGDEIDAELVGYSATTGEPLFTISCTAWCPQSNFWSRLFHSRDETPVFHLARPGLSLFSWPTSEIPLSVLEDPEAILYWR